MMKAALISSLVASTAAVSQKEALQSANAIHAKTHKVVEDLKDFVHHHAAKTITANKAVTVKSRGVSKTTRPTVLRTLRGKGGKGKGKGKGDNDDDDDDDSVEKARTYYQAQYGSCAGENDSFGVPLQNDFFYDTFAIGLETCVDTILPDGMPVSQQIVVESTSPVTLVMKGYSFSGCRDDNFDFSQDITSSLTMGLPVNGVCTNTEGFSVKLSLTETPETMSSSPAYMQYSYTEGYCESDFYEFQMSKTAIWTPTSTWMPMCFQGSFDSDDDNNDIIPSGSHSFDTSNCEGASPSLTMNSFTDSFCSVSDSSELMSTEFCNFDWEHFAEELALENDMDILFESNKCTSGSTPVLTPP